MVKYIRASKDYLGKILRSEFSAEEPTYFEIIETDIFPNTTSFRFRGIDNPADEWVGLLADDASIDYLLSIFPKTDYKGKVIDEDYLIGLLPTDVMIDEDNERLSGLSGSYFATSEDFSEYMDLVDGSYYAKTRRPVDSATKITSAAADNEYNLKDDINDVADKFGYITEGLYQISEGEAKGVIAELDDTLNDYIVEVADKVTDAITSSTRCSGKSIKAAAAKIKAENEGILEVPEGKNVDDLPVSHFKKLIDKNGRQPIIRALTNLEVWNKNDNKSLSSWAKKMKKSLEGYGEKE